MSCRTDALCHSGRRNPGHDRQPAHLRKGRKKKVKHLEWGGGIKKEKSIHERDDLTPANSVRTGTRTGNRGRRFLAKSKGVQDPEGAQGAETKSWGGAGGAESAARSNVWTTTTGSSPGSRTTEFSCFQSECSHIVYSPCS